MPTKPESKSQAEAARLLQPMLSELIALSLYSKQAHWNLKGPLFGPLHLFFDQLTDAVRLHYDTLAERMLALGSPADGRPDTVATQARTGEFPQGLVRDRKAVALMLERLSGAAARLRSGVAALGDLDLVTQDLIIGIIADLEKQAWMLRAQA